MIAGPVFLVFVVVIIVVFVFHHHQRVYHNRQRLDMEDPSCEMCLSKDKTLQDLVYDLSTSGSGSGREALTGWDRGGQAAGAGCGSVCCCLTSLCCPGGGGANAACRARFSPESPRFSHSQQCVSKELLPATLRETRAWLAVSRGSR